MLLGSGAAVLVWGCYLEHPPEEVEVEGTSHTGGPLHVLQGGSGHLELTGIHAHTTPHATSHECVYAVHLLVIFRGQEVRKLTREVRV